MKNNDGYFSGLQKAIAYGNMGLALYCADNLTQQEINWCLPSIICQECWYMIKEAVENPFDRKFICRLVAAKTSQESVMLLNSVASSGINHPEMSHFSKHWQEFLYGDRVRAVETLCQKDNKASQFLKEKILNFVMVSDQLFFFAALFLINKRGLDYSIDDDISQFKKYNPKIIKPKTLPWWVYDYNTEEGRKSIEGIKTKIPPSIVLQTWEVRNSLRIPKYLVQYKKTETPKSKDSIYLPMYIQKLKPYINEWRKNIDPQLERGILNESEDTRPNGYSRASRDGQPMPDQADAGDCRSTKEKGVMAEPAK